MKMRRFIDWFNDCSPQGGALSTAIARAAIAHLLFETIHPFEDGNGRIGRAIAEKASDVTRVIIWRYGLLPISAAS